MAIPQNVKDFLNKFVPVAQAEQARSGIPASLLLAQLAEESSWGKSELATKYNNLFGIKTSSAWKGPTVAMNNKAGNDPAVYRVYSSMQEGITGRTEFFQVNKRYGNLLTMTDSLKMADELQAQTYATNKNYASNLKSIINKYNLKSFDNASPLGFKLTTSYDSPFKGTVHPHSGSSGSFKKWEDMTDAEKEEAFKDVEINGGGRVGDGLGLGDFFEGVDDTVQGGADALMNVQMYKTIGMYAAVIIIGIVLIGLVVLMTMQSGGLKTNG